jgi:heavy metal efflux system protein
VLEQLAHQVQGEMSRVRGITDLGIFPVLGQPNLDIRIDRDKIARYGLNTGDVNTVIQAAMGGAIATQVLEGDREWNLVVRYPPEDRDSIEKIRSIKVGYTTAGGGTAYIPLSELATISLDTGASWIYHETMVRFIPIKFSVRGRDLAGAVSEAQQRIARDVTLPPGYRIIWSGEFEDLQQAKHRLEFVVPVSLMLIVLLLYSLFNSFRDTLLSLAGIPVGVIGGVWALWITGQPFSISAAIGFVSLFGVSVMNSILMLTFYNQARERGLEPLDAMYQAATKRMRPLLMTSLSACIGLLPAAMSHGIGSQVQRPLATVIVGGMLLGPVLLLLAVPPLRMVFLGKEEMNGRHSPDAGIGPQPPGGDR